MIKYFAKYKSKVIIKYLYIDEIHSFRRVAIYLPSTYDGVKRFPVLYGFDGQTMFFDERSLSNHSWRVQDGVESSIKKGISEGVIVVGVYCHKTKREVEYTPFKWEVRNEFYDKNVTDGPEGNQLLNFYTNKLKSYIDKNYLTLNDKDNTFIFGSSCGGLMAYYAISKYPQIYKKAGIFSSASWLVDNKLSSFVRKSSINNENSAFICVGDNEICLGENKNPKVYVNASKKIYEILKEKGLSDLKLLVGENYIHSETAWEIYFRYFIEWLFSTTKN